MNVTQKRLHDDDEVIRADRQAGGWVGASWSPAGGATELQRPAHTHPINSGSWSFGVESFEGANGSLSTLPQRGLGQVA